MVDPGHQSLGSVLQAKDGTEIMLLSSSSFQPYEVHCWTKASPNNAMMMMNVGKVKSLFSIYAKIS